MSIDDFGTGWASLTYLREFPAHALKIDRTFIAGLGETSRDLAIVKSIIAIGRSSASKSSRRASRRSTSAPSSTSSAATRGQGYLFGRPAPADELSLHGPGDEATEGDTHPAPLGATDSATTVLAVRHDGNEPQHARTRNSPRRPHSRLPYQPVER